MRNTANEKTSPLSGFLRSARAAVRNVLQRTVPPPENALVIHLPPPTSAWHAWSGESGTERSLLPLTSSPDPLAQTPQDVNRGLLDYLGNADAARLAQTSRFQYLSVASHSLRRELSHFLGAVKRMLPHSIGYDRLRQSPAGHDVALAMHRTAYLDIHRREGVATTRDLMVKENTRRTQFMAWRKCQVHRYWDKVLTSGTGVWQDRLDGFLKLAGMAARAGHTDEALHMVRSVRVALERRALAENDGDSYAEHGAEDMGAALRSEIEILQIVGRHSDAVQVAEQHFQKVLGDLGDRNANLARKTYAMALMLADRPGEALKLIQEDVSGDGSYACVLSMIHFKLGNLQESEAQFQKIQKDYFEELLAACGVRGDANGFFELVIRQIDDLPKWHDYQQDGTVESLMGLHALPYAKSLHGDSRWDVLVRSLNCDGEALKSFELPDGVHGELQDPLGPAHGTAVPAPPRPIASAALVRYDFD